MKQSNVIKMKSEELQLPFANVLSGYVTELLLECIVTMAEMKDLWLMNSKEIGMRAYQKSPVLHLAFCYVGDKELSFVEEEIKIAVNRCLQKHQFVLQEPKDAEKPKASMLLSAEASRKEQSAMEFTIGLEDMYIPYTITVEKMNMTHSFPREERLHLLMENDRTISVLCYPLEQQVAQDLAEIISQLELLNDMAAYLRVYDVLLKYSLEGRKVKDELQACFANKPQMISDKPYKLWKSYASYHYMKKKWKVLLRQEKRDHPTWEEVHGTIDRFLEPLWKAVCADEIFFADWMPEIQRFLD